MDVRAIAFVRAVAFDGSPEQSREDRKQFMEELERIPGVTEVLEMLGQRDRFAADIAVEDSCELRQLRRVKEKITDLKIRGSPVVKACNLVVKLI